MFHFSLRHQVKAKQAVNWSGWNSAAQPAAYGFFSVDAMAKEN